MGSERLFNKCWNENANVVELSAKGHSKCDECSRIEVLRDTIGLRTDEGGKAQMLDLEQREDLHRKEHRGERNYADDMWFKAEACPRKITMLNMDAPTTDQLQIPVQPRAYRDVAKGLESAPGWVSKMMGVMIAGYGMLCFLAHQRLGGRHSHSHSSSPSPLALAL